MRKSTTLIPVLLLILIASSVSAQQQSQPQLERGAISISQPLNPQALYEFSGPNASITGFIPTGDGVVLPSCGPCIGGDQAVISGYFNSEKRVSVTIDGVSSDMYVHIELFLSGATITFPNRMGIMFGSITVPATLTGTLTGYRQNPSTTTGPNDPAFVAPLNFQGLVTVYTQVFFFNGVSNVNLRQIIFFGTPIHSLAKE